MDETEKRTEEGAPKQGDEFRKTTEWRRPVAMARNSNVGHWLVLLALVCFGIALWAPLSRLYWQMHNRAVSAGGGAARTASSFVAISYEGVAAEAGPGGPFVSTSLFRSHVAALKEAGYVPIGLEDVRAFYYEGRPLPKKALLLTFENCHKSTYFQTRDFLAQQRWRAVMGVVTKPVREGSQDVLLRPYLKGMVLDATWDLADESDSGAEFVLASSRGREAPFFSTPMWLREENRHERFAEFQARIARDHTNSIAEFTGNLGARPVAFFFPGGNYGQYEEGNQILREANLASVAEHYDLGFILNKNALNDAGTDRRRINRLQVSPGWTADQLVAHLDNSWPVEARRGREDSRVEPGRWIPDWGLFERQRDGFALRAEPAADPLKSDAGASGGARAWIAGSNSFRDGSFEIRFHLIRGEFHAYLRFNADDSWLRVAITDAGRASVSQCVPGGGPQSIAHDAIEDVSDFRSVHTLLVTLRDDVVFVRLDGSLLFGGAVVVGESAPGMVGLAIWAPPLGLAQVNVAECHLRSRIDAVVTWAPALNRDAGYLMRQLNNTAFRYTIVSPPWLDVYASSPITFPALDARALGIVAKANHNRVFPSLALHDAQALASLGAGEVVSHLVADAASGVFVDAADFPIDKLAPLKEWILGLRDELAGRGLGLAIRFPPAVGGLAAVGDFVAPMPEALVVDEGGEPPPGVAQGRVLQRILIDPPATDEDMTLFYQLSDYSSRAADAVPETTLLRKAGLKAYSEGRYADAAEKWAQWQRRDPRSAEAWTFLGNAFSRLRDNERAAEAYGNSLALEPGQLQLMVERAKLLEASGRPGEAANLLDTYARAFPENAGIAIAQAHWLDRHGRRAAGREILSSIITNSPTDIRCRLSLQGLLDDPQDRYRNMHELLDIGAAGNSQLLGFGHDIEAAELLAVPEASVFFDFIRETAATAPNESVRSLYASFLPFTNAITEKFDASRLSDNWIALGTPLASIAGAYDLKAASDMSEAYLRLKKSELIRDGFVEVALGESVGAFWLYARRSSRSMIRFGFDGDGYVRIQAWHDGEIRAAESVAWIRPAGDVTLRLEVRGDGAIGLIDGKAVFSTPLKIPGEIAYGWWSIAPFSPELGIARARIGHISAGPLGPSLVLMRETDPDATERKLDALRPLAREISALAPVLFAQHADGTVLATPLADLMPYRMFCSYHRIRLVPVVALDFYSDVNPETLVKILLEHRLGGLVLLVRTMPHEEWFEEMAALLERTTADLIVVQSEDPVWPRQDGAPPARKVTLREIQRGSLLVQPNEVQWELPVARLPDWRPARAVPSSTPVIVAVPQEEDPPAPATPAEATSAEAAPAAPAKAAPAKAAPAKAAPAEAAPAEAAIRQGPKGGVHPFTARRHRRT